MIRAGNVTKAHRLLAPRIAYLIGSRNSQGGSNLIPVSNVTSVSVSPELIAVAIFREWETYTNLQTASGFTLSVPRFEHLEGVWRLGSRYSRHSYESNAEKLRSSGLSLLDDPARSGPILADGLGWAECHIVQRVELNGDHGLFIGEILHVEFDDGTFTEDGEPVADVSPAMQVTGNIFATTTDVMRVPYGSQ